MTLSSVIKFLHLLATVTWIGGMVYINFVLIPSLAVINSSERGKLMGTVAKRFGMLSGGSVAVLLVTGLISTPSPLLFNLHTTWGATLAIKHLVVLSMIIIGLLITFRIAPKLQSLAPLQGEPPTSDHIKVQKQLSLLGQVNMILGVLVLFFAASL